MIYGRWKVWTGCCGDSRQVGASGCEAHHKAFLEGETLEPRPHGVEGEAGLVEACGKETGKAEQGQGAESGLCLP